MADDLQKISPEKRLFQSIVEETVDDIYVINKENYNLLYTNELKNGFLQEESRVGKNVIRSCMESRNPVNSAR